MTALQGGIFTSQLIAGGTPGKLTEGVGGIGLLGAEGLEPAGAQFDDFARRPRPAPRADASVAIFVGKKG